MWTSKSLAFCEKLGIQFPIIQAPMAGGPTTAELVTAVSENGGIGSLGAGYLTPEKLSYAIGTIRNKTDKLFSVNLMIPPTEELSTQISIDALTALNGISKHLTGKDVVIPKSIDSSYSQQFEVVVRSRVKMVSATFGTFSKEEIGILKNADLLFGATATCVEEARFIESIGSDFVIAQGFEAGGHRGGFQAGRTDKLVGTLALVPQVVDAVKIPVIASGGIMDGRGIVSALALGASAVQMGSAFLATKESGATAEWKERLFEAADIDTALTRCFSGKLARGIMNRYMEIMGPFEHSLPSYPIMNRMTSDLRTTAQSKGDVEFQSLWAGQAAQLARNLSAAELIQQLRKEVQMVINDFQKSFF